MGVTTPFQLLVTNAQAKHTVILSALIGGKLGLFTSECNFSVVSIALAVSSSFLFLDFLVTFTNSVSFLLESVGISFTDDDAIVEEIMLSLILQSDQIKVLKHGE